jgi:hypothetical protein
MEAGFRTPLLDMFRRGEVSREIKMLAARGALAPRAHEQVMLLVELVADPEPEIRLVAEETIAAIPRQALEGFLARSDASATLREFFAARGIQSAAIPAADSDEPLIDRNGPEDPQVGPEASGPEAADKQGTLQRLTSMTVAARMKVALKGTREERAILIRDPNRMVSVSVLSSPKVNESELEGFAKMANVSDEVLRIIGHTRAWVKNYGIASALARNPKTPVAVALNLVQRLNERDLKLISLDRNAQEPLKIAVRKRLIKGKKE